MSRSHSGAAGGTPSAGVFAAADIGSHSTRLLVAAVQNGRMRELDRRAIITKLGDGVSLTGRLSAGSVEDTLDALRTYAQICQRMGVVRAAAVATSAVRDAEDGESFLDRARQAFGVRPVLLAGEEEGRLTFAGVMSGASGPSAATGADDSGEPPILVFDIGGGSTELAGRAADSDNVVSVSLQLGCVRLKDAYLEQEPLADRAVKAAGERAMELLSSVASAFRSPDGLVGVAGTVTTLVAIRDAIEPYDRSRVDGALLKRNEVEDIVTRLRGMSLQDRGRLPGLQPKRADVVIPGALIVLAVMEVFGIDSITVSESDLLDGLLLRVASGGSS